MTGPAGVERPPEGLERARAGRGPGTDADVGDPEVLEQLPGLGEVDDRLAQPRLSSRTRRPMTGIRSTARS